jgi:hypothetical protein
MEALPWRIKLEDGSFVRTADHDVKVETCDIHIQPVEQTFTDDRHINLIIDGELVALMSRWRLVHGELILFPCPITLCYCKFTGPLYARQVAAETDVTLSEPVRHLVEQSAIDRVAA